MKSRRTLGVPSVHEKKSKTPRFFFFFLGVYWPVYFLFKNTLVYIMTNPNPLCMYSDMAVSVCPDLFCFRFTPGFCYE